MPKRRIILALLLTASLGLIAMSTLPKYSTKILLGRLISESGGFTLTSKSYGAHPRHRLDIYRPEASTIKTVAANTHPILFFLYGGGWRQGKREIYRFVGAAFAKRGYTTVIPDYRTYPETSFPGFIEDAALAYHWVWKNIAKGRPIIVMGHSAGAHSAAMIALNRDYISQYDRQTTRPAALIGISGPYAFDPTTWPSTRDIFATARNADAARPAAHVDGNAPPALLMHGLKDSTVRLFNLETLAANYKKAGRSVTVKTYPNLSHIDIILTIARPLRWHASVFDDILKFIEAHNRAAR